jgi:bifunctional non-homologous end joining protein LigD
MPRKPRSGKRRPAAGSRPLQEYREKRDFERTDEPAGTEPDDNAGDGLRFVVQKHAASHLHFDLRLELDGVMLSWAVPKGPSLDPSSRRLAMQVEDHPIEYNTFEGTIPKGEYGGGTVMLWDRGTYAPDELPPGADPQSAVRSGVRSGKLAFSLQGERLTGSFALVRTDAGPKPKWLLIKHRDEAARAGSDIVAETATSVVSGRTMDEIAADGDQVWRSDRAAGSGRASRAAGSRRAADPSGGQPGVAARSEAIPPMTPTPVRSLPTEGEWTFEPWHGGRQVLAYATPDSARIMDVRARDITRDHPDIARELQSLARRAGTPFVLDGEIASPDDSGGAVFYASDLLLEGDNVRLDEPWIQRRDALDRIFHRRRVQRVRRQQLLTPGPRLVDRVRRNGWAGVLTRRTDARYKPGTRSRDFLRLAVEP